MITSRARPLGRRLTNCGSLNHIFRTGVNLSAVPGACTERGQQQLFLVLVAPSFRGYPSHSTCNVPVTHYDVKLPCPRNESNWVLRLWVILLRS
ncbi:hypothetical protein BaRGS_00010266 [Batillaria attramentaria]|uniref:Uncharacterized protein n=1 Tax=Batillaria attramentaria TaxID=370345 RepID=A0ABD0LH85_9CAEN